MYYGLYCETRFFSTFCCNRRLRASHRCPTAIGRQGMVKEIALTSSQGQLMTRMTFLTGSGVPQRHVMIKAQGEFVLFANFMAGPRTGTTWGASAQRAGTTKSSHWSLIEVPSLFSRDFPPQSLSGWVTLPYLLNYMLYSTEPIKQPKSVNWCWCGVGFSSFLSNT